MRADKASLPVSQSYGALAAKFRSLDVSCGQLLQCEWPGQAFWFCYKGLYVMWPIIWFVLLGKAGLLLALSNDHLTLLLFPFF